MIVIRMRTMGKIKYYGATLTSILVTILVLVSISCTEGHDLTVKNNLEVAVTIWASNGYDPTLRTYGGTEESYVTLGTLNPGDKTTFKTVIFPYHDFYIVEAKEKLLTSHSASDPTVFIRKYTWRELKDIDWEVVIDPGSEEPNWALPPESITITNDFEQQVMVIIQTTNSSKAIKGDYIHAIVLDPHASITEIAAIKSKDLYYIVTADERFENESEYGDRVFIRRYSWDDLESLNWAIIIEPGYEKPDW